MAGVRVVLVDEAGQICLVRHAYGRQDWNVPGGGIDQGESLLAAAAREVQEETGIRAQIESLIGIYSIPETHDLVTWLRARVVADESWSPNSEIREVRFCLPETFPEPMHPCVRRCLDDAVAGQQGVVRVLNMDGSVVVSLAPRHRRGMHDQ